MKKFKIQFVIVAMAMATLLSCGDDDPSFKKENPLTDYLKAAGFTEVSDEINGGDYEFGITFIPKVQGKITAVVVKLPDARTDLRVTIWDADTETVLQTEMIASVSANVAFTKSITPLNLTKNKEYMITFNSNDWFDRTKSDGSDAVYPFHVGNISVTGYGYHSGTDQTYPDSFQTDYYAGDLGFIFLQTK